MKNTKFLWYFILFAFLFTTACSKDEEETPPPAINESNVLATFLESTDSPLGKDYVATDLPSITSAEAVHNDLLAGNEIYIIDIRSDADFALGHIDGAENVAAGNVLTYLDTEGIAKTAKIVFVCYTGQTAGWVTSMVRIAGYGNAFSMKWGMSSWNPFFAATGWEGKTSNMYATQFEDDAVAMGPKGGMPTLSTGKTTGQEILDARLAAVFAEGFNEAKIASSAVFDNPANYYVVNYWAEEDYTHYGHIPGAMQYTPKVSMNTTVDLTTLPTDKTIVVYCWTGQTSAFLTAYLRVLGYNAKSLVFGTNGMIYDELESHKWSVDEIKEYDYVP